MSQTSLLNKPLWNNITRLKLLNKPDGPVKFILEKSPFDEEEMDAAAPKDIIITGRILPDSKIYREGAYRIEMKLLPSYPCNPPEVRFLTPIYHPNVGQDGKKK
jgi:ubiquitin-protein ligase